MVYPRSSLLLMTGVVAEKVLPSRFEKQTLYMLDRRRLIHKEQIAAVRLLQCAFRLRRRRLARDRITVRGGSLSLRINNRVMMMVTDRCSSYSLRSDAKSLRNRRNDVPNWMIIWN